MHAIRTIRVVLGEGHPGLLRLVLEAQGFEVIGHAHDDEELLRILDLTSPSVVVLDAGISAIAAAEAAIRSGDAAIVLVWPRDVVTSIAAERVEPASAILEIGNAVRRASERRPAEEVIRVPEASTPTDPIDVASEPTSPEPSPPGSASPGRARRATRHVLVAVAAWVLSITALGAIGVALPGVFRALDRPRTSQPSPIDRADQGRVLDRERTPSPEVSNPDRGTRPECAPDREAEPDAGRGKGCGRGASKGRAGDRTGPEKGRPDEPGKSGDQGNADQPPGSNGKRGGGHGAQGSSDGSEDPTQGGGTPSDDGQGHGRGGGRGLGSDDGDGDPVDPPGGGKPTDPKAKSEH
jgi:hypothetical protein